MKQLIPYFSAFSFVLISGCETYSHNTVNKDRTTSGPQSCELFEIANWMRKQSESVGDYSTYEIRIVEFGGNWKVYFYREVKGVPQAGGTPTAILDGNSCELLELYITQ